MLFILLEQEELLREMGVQAGKPTPEVALLRQQIDQLQNRHRTELAIFEQERLQLQQQLNDEVLDSVFSSTSFRSSGLSVNCLCKEFFYLAILSTNWLVSLIALQ